MNTKKCILKTEAYNVSNLPAVIEQGLIQYFTF